MDPVLAMILERGGQSFDINENLWMQADPNDHASTIQSEMFQQTNVTNSQNNQTNLDLNLWAFKEAKKQRYAANNEINPIK